MDKGWLEVARVDELPSGERLFFEVDGQPIVLLNIGGIFFAIGDTCTHDNGPLGDGEVIGTTIACPRHGARFDLLTGKVLSPPAAEDVPSYPVKVEEQRIFISI
jgi:3-phenylpropionate/trans-cinnamate dioxygenase ferredoxin subunit